MSGSSAKGLGGQPGRDHLRKIYKAVGNWLQGSESHGAYWQNPRGSLFLGLASDLPSWKASSQFYAGDISTEPASASPGLAMPEGA